MNFAGIETEKMNDSTTTTIPSILSIDIVHKTDDASMQNLRMTLLLVIMAWGGVKLLLMLLANMLNK